MAKRVFAGYSLDDVALQAPTVPVTVKGTTYDLSADIPADLMLDWFLLQKYPLMERLREVETALGEGAAADRHAYTEAMRAAAAEYNAEVRALCGRVFRNSGYALDDAAIDDLLDAKAQVKIVSAFFTHLMTPSSPPENAGQPPAPSSPTTGTTTTPGPTKKTGTARG